MRKTNAVAKGTQYDTLLSHFENRGSISAVEAQMFYRIRALPRRISDLENRGHVFRRERCVDPTGQRYVRYHYVKPVVWNVDSLGVVRFGEASRVAA